MRNTLLILFSAFLLQSGFAQDSIPSPCDYKANIDSEVLKLKLTKEYLVWFKNLGALTEYIELSLTKNDSLQFVNFTKTKIDYKVENDSICFTNKTRLYLQGQNSQIAVLPFVEENQCSKLTRLEETNEDLLSLNGVFLLTPQAKEILTAQPINFMRIAVNDSLNMDYVLRERILDPKFGIEAYPERYFMEQLPCID